MRVLFVVVLVPFASIFFARGPTTPTEPAAVERVVSTPRIATPVRRAPSNPGPYSLLAHDKCELLDMAELPEHGPGRIDVAAEWTLYTGFMGDRDIDRVTGLVTEHDLVGLSMGWHTESQWLRAIRDLEHLERLQFDGEGISDTDLASLHGLSRLEYLELGLYEGEHNDVTDAGMRALLSSLPRLRYLGAQGYDIGGTALAGLSDEARFLDLNGTAVTAVGVRHLRDKPQLHTLSLAHTLVGDDALRALEGHPSLEVVDLRGTLVSEAMIPSLKTLPKLQRVVLSRDQWDLVETVRAEGIPADEIAWLRGNLGCQAWTVNRAG